MIELNTGFENQTLLIIAFGLVGFLITLRNPIWGIILIISLDNMVDILPQVELFSSILVIIGIITFISILLRQIKTRERFTPIGLLGTICFVWFLCSIIIGQYAFNIPVTRNWIFTYIQLILLVWMVMQCIRSKQDVELLMKGLLFFFLINAVVGLSSLYLLLDTSAISYTRISGLTQNANVFAYICVIGLIFCLYYLKESKGILKLSLYLAALLFLVGNLYSGSRGGIVLLTFSIAYLILRQKLIGRRIFLVILIIGIVIFSLEFLPEGILQRYTSIIGLLVNPDDTWELRLLLWQKAISLWENSPIFGIGNDGFVYQSAAYQLSELHRPFAAVIHNTYVSILTENGLFGFLPFLIIIVISLKDLFSIPKAINSAEDNQLITVWQIILLILLITALKGNIQGKKLLWLAFGMSMAIGDIFKKIKFERDKIEKEKVAS